MNAANSELTIFDRKIKAERDYWLNKLSDDFGETSLRPDYARPLRYAGDVSGIELELAGDAFQQLLKLTGDGNFLIYTTLMSALKVCLYKYSGSHRVVVGSPAHRQDDSQARVANALPIVDEVNSRQTFREFLLQVRQTLLDAYARQSYPYKRLLKDLGLTGIENKCPLFDVALRMDELHGTLPTVKNDVTITFRKEDERIAGRVEFNARLFKPESVTAFIRHWMNVLESALKDTGRRVAELQTLTAEERHQVLVEWNDTPVEHPGSSCIHEVFEEHAARTPDALAVVLENERLTYGELDTRANQLGHYLQALGVGPEVMVGIYLERSLDMVVAILGILKAGGVYVPLDTNYPESRLSFMLEDAHVRVLVSREELISGLPDYTGRVVFVDQEAEQLALQSQEKPAARVTEDNLAYVIYTSGSTGVPKGTMLQHAGLCNVTRATIQKFGITQDKHVLQFALLNFDASVWQIFMALHAGAPLHLVSQEALFSIPRLSQLICEYGATTADLPPAVLSLLPPESVPTLRTVSTGGERCAIDLATRWSQDRSFYNVYGPTETTVAACWYLVESVPEGTTNIPIGRPFDNVRMYVLDADLEPTPAGIPGELHIGGAGVARGYYERPGATAQKFIPDPFGAQPGGRLYKTGDLVRYLPDGNIEFLGRLDNQVKLRGFRIELGEIEAALEAYPGIRDAVVLIKDNSAGDKRLVAYILPEKADHNLINELRQSLRQRLPDFMVPSVFVLLESLPLMPNGKVNLKALPLPDDLRPEVETEFIGPRTPVEETVAEIWSQLLGVQRIGVNDNFFELGGHSMLVTQVMSRLSDVFGADLPLRLLFESPTVAGLASAILQSGVEEDEQITRLFDELEQLTDDQAEQEFTDGIALAEGES